MRLHLIGDVHGKWLDYSNILHAIPMGERSIQLGDMGIGFKNDRVLRTGKAMKDHKFFRGNHDNPAECRAHPNYYGDWKYDPVTKIFNVAGAFSIDYAWRVDGINWWRDEELPYGELDEVVDWYSQCKPEIMLSHECPSTVTPMLLSELIVGYGSGEYFRAKLECAKSRTSAALQRMFEIHQPKQWFFGHYHIDRAFELNGTAFRCLAELSHTSIEVGEEPSEPETRPTVGFIQPEQAPRA